MVKIVAVRQLTIRYAIVWVLTIIVLSSSPTHVYVSCDLESKSSPHCEKDPSLETKIRLYDITVTATDSAGRKGTDTCRIVVVPECKKKNSKTSKKASAFVDGDNVDVCEDFHDHHHRYNHDLHEDHEHDHHESERKRRGWQKKTSLC